MRRGLRSMKFSPTSGRSACRWHSVRATMITWRAREAAWLQELRGPNVWIDGDQFALGDHSFRVLGWLSSPPVAVPSELWVTHCPPDLCPTGIVRGGVDFGDFEFGELCRSGLGPRVAMSGHCHDRQRWCA